MNMKHLLKYSHRFSLLFWLLACSAQQLLASDVLHQADSLYSNHRYSEALRQYQQLQEKDHYLKHNFELNFKMAVCFLRNDELDSALQIFRQLQRNDRVLSEYVDYFLFLIAVKQEKSAAQVPKIGNDFIDRHANHFLADSILFHLADFEFRHRQYTPAVKHYSMLLKKKSL